jgi:hypothetical protein
MFSFIRLVVFTRWGRYLIAVILLFCATAVTISAFSGSTIKTKSGTIEKWEELVDANTNAYKSSLLTLSGDSTTYQFVRTDFTPAFQESEFAAGSPVDIWYTQSPANNPDLVAVQITDPQGGAALKFVTDAYVHPDTVRNSNLVLAGVFYVLTLVMVVVATVVPTASRRRRQPETDGTTVVGGGPAQNQGQVYRPPEHGGSGRR